MIAEEPAKMIIGGQTHAGGILYLTNQRIVYEKKTGSGMGGLFGGGSLETLMDANLTEVRNVTSSKPMIPIPFLSKDVVRIEFHGSSYEFAVQDSQGWKGSIIRTVSECQDNEEHRREGMRAVEEENRRREEEDRRIREREQWERQYKLEVDKHKAAAEGAAYVAKAGASSTSIQVGQIGESRTDVRDSVLQRSNIGGPSVPGGGGGGGVCPSCASPVQTGWKACPNCMTKLQAGCPHCGASVQPQWKACPACGNPI